MIDLSKIKEHLSDSSRKLADLTANMVFDEPSLVIPLLEVAWMDEYPWCQRASRVLWICSEQYPQLLQPHLSKIIRNLADQKSESVRRNFLKLFVDHDFRLKEKDSTMLMDLCFDYLNGSYSVGVKAYSMVVLYKLTKGIPEIQRELYEIIESQMEEASAGFKSQGMKIMKKISSGLR
ncbi:MAG TPA: hypothetical protein VK179_02545 [Bacteroidales bacterium]|nr:hypothetical protein [Bacteroidales bacterium]